MEELPGTYNILHFTLGGEESFMSESCSDDDIAENVTKALRRFSGDPCLPYPTGSNTCPRYFFLYRCLALFLFQFVDKTKKEFVSLSIPSLSS